MVGPWIFVFLLLLLLLLLFFTNVYHRFKKSTKMGIEKFDHHIMMIIKWTTNEKSKLIFVLFKHVQFQNYIWLMEMPKRWDKI